MLIDFGEIVGVSSQFRRQLLKRVYGLPISHRKPVSYQTSSKRDSAILQALLVLLVIQGEELPSSAVVS
jgi:hypothetical protein